MKDLDKSQIFILLALAAQFLISIYIACPGQDESDESFVASADQDSLTIEILATDQLTPLELLLEQHQVEYRGSMMGAFVKGIDSVENSSAAFWIYSVNDTTPKVACDKMTLKAGDRLKWHFRLVDGATEADSSSNN